MKPNIAFVVQRCGETVNGGAEQHCLIIAKKMSKFWNIEIITTCAKDYISWENFYSEGKREEAGIIINRFKVDKKRNIKEFNSLSDRINMQDYVNQEEADRWMEMQGPFSPICINT